MNVPPAPPGTHEDLLHRAVGSPALFVFPDAHQSRWLSSWRGHRAIGVVYRPNVEARGNWVPSRLGERYDAFLSFDDTDALTPLDTARAAPTGELETYPWAV
jgi:erythromycin esterase-like protein